MVENEGIRTEDARSCLLCGSEGELLYSSLRDPLFRAPGNWSLMQCPNCQLACLSPRPLPEDIGAFYSQYFPHQVPYAPNRCLAGLRKRAKASILRSSSGHQIVGSIRILGSVFTRISMLEDFAGSGECYLRYIERKRLLNVVSGNRLFLYHMRRFCWDFAGGEPVSVACIKFGLEVFHGSLEEAKFQDRYLAMQFLTDALISQFSGNNHVYLYMFAIFITLRKVTYAD